MSACKKPCPLSRPRADACHHHDRFPDPDRAHALKKNLFRFWKCSRPNAE
jgi:hypothetical protein